MATFVLRLMSARNTPGGATVPKRRHLLGRGAQVRRKLARRRIYSYVSEQGEVVTRRLTVGLLAFALMLAAAPIADAATVWFDGAIINRHVRPSPLWLSADGTLVVLNVHWSRWGGRVAVGRGTAEYHGCAPSCGQAPAHHVSVTINLWDIVSCSGRAYYNKVTLYERRGKLPVRFQRWAPCST